MTFRVRGISGELKMSHENLRLVITREKIHGCAHSLVFLKGKYRKISVTIRYNCRNYQYRWNAREMNWNTGNHTSDRYKTALGRFDAGDEWLCN
jgi:hypothetical protein